MRRIVCYLLLLLGLLGNAFAQLPENLEFKHGISFFTTSSIHLTFRISIT